ncbi:MAG: hypothetical protein HC882_02415 [Acidobacteria bacterium]|nr:hypothetical protein [Acidobacteriota bacterium]
MEPQNFTDVLRDLAFGLAAVAVPVVLAFVARSATFLIQAFERSISERSQGNLAFIALSRLVREVDDFITDASGIASGELAAFRRPESLGGVTVTDEEWKAWAKVLARRFIEGMGETWLERLSDAIGLSPIGTKAKIEQVVAADLMRRSDAVRATAIAPPRSSASLPALQHGPPYLSPGLDSAEKQRPGHGKLDLGVVWRPERIEARADLEHRFERWLSGYATAWAGRDRDALDWDVGAGAGLRVRW